MKRALYYSLYLPNPESMRYYSMLWRSLETHHDQGEFDQYDIVVAYSAPGIDFAQYRHLDRFNLMLNYPRVKFIASDYHEHSSDPYMHKWYNLDRVFDLGYAQVLMLDCDTVFIDRISPMFDRYFHTNAVHVLLEGANSEFLHILGGPGMGSGQVFISRQVWQQITDFYGQVKTQQAQITQQAKETMSEPTAQWFTGLSEQYAAQLVLKDHGIMLNRIDQRDINYGTNSFSIEVVGNTAVITSINSRILHYLSKNDWIFMTPRLFTPDMHDRKAANIHDGQFVGRLD